MGLFDGRGATAEGSTAQVAELLAAPVVFVVDASAQGRSVAALVSGFASFGAAVRVAGVILNRVGSARHEEILRDALAGIGMPVLGALRRHDAITAPSRHLGLVPTAEREGAARETLAQLAALIASAVDLDAVLAVARSAPSLPVDPWDPAAVLTPPGVPRRPAFPSASPVSGVRRRSVRSRVRPVVAVAGGAAFSFCYTETVELLAAAGADVVAVDPLRDEALPEGTAALVLGGGFPEVHAMELSANERLRADVARLARSGAPIVAECAGLLYLARDLDGLPMCGVIGASARMTGTLTLGYRNAVAASGSFLAPVGAAVRGHEFHRTTVEPVARLETEATPSPAWWFGSRAEGFVQGSVHASYLHLHWAGHPEIATRLVAAASAATPRTDCPASPRAGSPASPRAGSPASPRPGSPASPRAVPPRCDSVVERVTTMSQRRQTIGRSGGNGTATRATAATIAPEDAP
jgi:cobyrinic acid a,c-diamide synthase